MNWLLKYLDSSIGRKIQMSLTGLFLCQFLVVHLIGNIQLLADDGGVAFNEYSEFMGHFLPIKIISYLLYGSILIHAFVGILSASKNKQARGVGYKVKKASKTTFASRNMALLGTLILAFILMHMSQFWYNSKFGEVKSGNMSYYQYAEEIFSQPIWMILYVLGQVVLGLHLYHGFQSAFQTLGINHPKFTPAIKGLGILFSIFIPLGFAMVAMGMYFGWRF